MLFALFEWEEWVLLLAVLLDKKLQRLHSPVHFSRAPASARRSQLSKNRVPVQQEHFFFSKKPGSCARRACGPFDRSAGSCPRGTRVLAQEEVGFPSRSRSQANAGLIDVTSPSSKTCTPACQKYVFSNTTFHRSSTIFLVRSRQYTQEFSLR